jgi:hypothetical protein
MVVAAQEPAEGEVDRPSEYGPAKGLDAELEPIPPMSPVPPAGYETTVAGNVMRSELSDSTILKSARVGQRIAWGTGVATGIMTGLQAFKDAFVSTFSGVGPVLLLVLGGVAVALAVMAFVYFRGIARKRVEMHDRGIA